MYLSRNRRMYSQFAVCEQQIIHKNAVCKQQMIIFATTILNYNSYGDAFC